MNYGANFSYATQSTILGNTTFNMIFDNDIMIT